MNVYVLIHDTRDYDSHAEVVGIYATRELAEGNVNRTQWHENWIIERAARQRMREGQVPASHKPERVHTWTWNGETRSRLDEPVWNFPWSTEHDKDCCTVDEMPVIGIPTVGALTPLGTVF